MTDRTALLTGAGGRLGRTIAAILQREGARVALADLDEDKAVLACRELEGEGSAVTAVAGDVSSEPDVARMIEQAESALGRIDLLVSAHGIFPNCPVVDVEVGEWDRVFAVNVRGTMLPCRHLARKWIERGTKGSIVNISSGAARSARAGGAHYTGSKAAVEMLTQVLAIELGPHGIRVNAVAPGLVLDEVITSESADLHPYVKLMLRGTPLRRTGSPADVAEAVAFLASERSAWTTGSVLEVSGGSHCGRPHVPLTRDLT
ncbi:MAG: SDR family oxidoreductase [Trueperaceae bacterium]